MSDILSDTQRCTGPCGQIKLLSEFHFRNETGKYRSDCKECHKERAKTRYQNNKEDYRVKNAQYRVEHKEEIAADKKRFAQEHKEEISEYQKQYRAENQAELNKKRNMRLKIRRKDDPAWSLRSDVSKSISSALRANSSSKEGKSILQYLGYTIVDLWKHLEKQFANPENLTPDGKVWMTPNNRGKYVSETWNDKDPATWTWQLDHIKPQSEFAFKSMEDQTFKDCWALSNLRPLSAKQNWFDGVNRVRHNK